jgi:hypothetical protein
MEAVDHADLLTRISSRGETIPPFMGKIQIFNKWIFLWADDIETLFLLFYSTKAINSGFEFPHSEINRKNALRSPLPGRAKATIQPSLDRYGMKYHIVVD